MAETVILVKVEPGTTLAKQGRPLEYLDMVLRGEVHVWRDQCHWSEAHRSGKTCNSTWCVVRPALCKLLKGLRMGIDSMPSLLTLKHATEKTVHLEKRLHTAEQVRH